MNTAVIGLGSNIDAERNIEAGKNLLAAKFKVKKMSSFFKTKPQGDRHMPDFINGGVLIETSMSCSELKDFLKNSEICLGRTDEMHSNKSRVIDFDIHVWNEEVIDPYFYQWDFIRKIVKELLPDLPDDRSKGVSL